MTTAKSMFARVILPLRFEKDISYKVPDSLAEKVVEGCFAKVKFSGKEYICVIEHLSDKAPDYSGTLMEIESLIEGPSVSAVSLKLWRWIADYYMCTIGEVYKAAVPSGVFNRIKRREKKSISAAASNGSEQILNSAQKEAYTKIAEYLSAGSPVLLKGVTGSGKTEIYITLAEEAISKGMNVLFMLPEIAVSRQLSHRLEKRFGEKMLIYHSGQTSSDKTAVFEKISKGDDTYLVLGLRSSVFLPFKSLGLVIIDEEHDHSYKQNEPSPRYNGHDTAIMLAKLHGAGIVMGSATPSLESIYNAYSGRFALVELNEKYHSDHTPDIEILDTIRAGKRGEMEGIFSKRVISEIERTLLAGEQALIFRNRRSYSPFVQCTYCGHIPKCSHCNVSVSYHKSREALTCHWCGYSVKFNVICTECGKPGLKERGSGTEMAEEQITKLFPQARVARFDAETASKKTEQKRIIKEFAKGEKDILIGTQMLSKGFDFEKLTLIVVLQADSMLSNEDFRAGERASQMLTQLAGRGGRRDKKATVLIQTAQPKNRVFKFFNSDDFSQELSERKEFGYPPFTRIIKVILKHKQRSSLNNFAARYEEFLKNSEFGEFTGPFAPPVDLVRGEYIINFMIKFKKSGDLKTIKRSLYDNTLLLVKREGGSLKLWFDVDPY